MPDVYTPRPITGATLPGLVGWLKREFDLVAEALRKPAGERAKVERVTAHYSVQADDALVAADATGGAITVTLPDPVRFPHRRLVVKRLNAGANLVTVAGTIDGVVNRTLTTQYQTLTVRSYSIPGFGSGWWVE